MKPTLWILGAGRFKKDFSCNGFTLLELMITTMILGIMGMLSLSAASFMVQDRRLSLAGQAMVAGLETTVSLCRQYQRPFTFSISVAGNRFEIIDTAPHPNTVPPAQLNNIPPVNASGVVFDRVGKKWYSVDFDTSAQMEGIAIISGPLSLSFDAMGNAPITDTSYVINSGGYTRTILVKGISGHISVQ